MGISRRDFFRAAGLAAATAAMPTLLKTRSVAAAVPPQYRVKHFGANIQTYCFDRNSRIRKDQIQQIKRWGFKKLRDNQVYAGWPSYDLNHARAVTQECLENGIQYTINAVNMHHGIENLMSESQWAAVLARYNGKSALAKIATASMGIGLQLQPYWDFLLNHASVLRSYYPQGVRMQAFNGPEVEGFEPWNMYDLEFRTFWRNLGFPVPNVTGDQTPVNNLIANNYLAYRNQVKSIWGQPWLDKSTHMYEYNGSWGIRIYVSPAANEDQQPIVTEWGVNRDQVPNLTESFRTMPIRMIELNAAAGVLVTDATGSYNILEMFLHTPLDPRFIDLWQQGRTQLLWNSRQYNALIASMTDNRNHWESYSGVFMDPPIASAVLATMQSLSSGSGSGTSGGIGGGRRFSALDIENRIAA